MDVVIEGRNKSQPHYYSVTAVEHKKRQEESCLSVSKESKRALYL